MSRESDWQDYFDVEILRRGMRYFREGRVFMKRQEMYDFEAVVIGTASYNVHVCLKNDKLCAAGCDCPYADTGELCKHMAATLFAITSEMDERPVAYIPDLLSDTEKLDGDWNMDYSSQFS